MNNDFKFLLESIQEFISQNIFLTDSERSLFFKFLSFFKKYNQRTIVYRGTKLLREDYTGISEELPEILFTLGDKARLFKQEDDDSFCDVEDGFQKSATILFDKIHEIFDNIETYFGTCNSKKYFENFSLNNPSFVDYFREEKNRDNFVKELMTQQDLLAFDYYFAFIHTIGSKIDQGMSQLSTTTSLEQAKKFQNNGILIVGWIPNTKRGFQIKRVDIVCADNYLKKSGLPTYRVAMYPEQKEICLKYGLLPHFILGYQRERSFVINHNLLNDLIKGRSPQDIMDNGINVNQKMFNEIMSRTALKHSYIVIDNLYCFI